MTADFFTPYARGGAAARSDSFTGMADPFQQALMAMLQNAPAEVKLGITSGYRSPETQAQLWKEALAKYGSPEEARKWVAPPGKSQHNHGAAADLEFMSPAAQEWVHQNAGRFGLAFPLGNEPWHVELASARGQGANPGGNALTGNAVSAMAQPTGNALSFIGRDAPTAATQRAVAFAPPEITFEPLTLPTRRRA